MIKTKTEYETLFKLYKRAGSLFWSLLGLLIILIIYLLIRQESWTEWKYTIFLIAGIDFVSLLMYVWYHRKLKSN